MVSMLERAGLAEHSQPPRPLLSVDTWLHLHHWYSQIRGCYLCSSAAGSQWLNGQWDVTSFWSKLTVFKALAMNVGLGSPMDREQVLIHHCLDGGSASLLGLLQPPGCFLPYICFHSLSLQRPSWSLAILGSRSSLTVFPEHCMPNAVHIIPVNNGKKQRLVRDPRTSPDMCH